MRGRIQPVRLWIVLIALLPELAMAFGANAHLVVGYIADQRICESTRASIEPLLEGESLAEAGLWADKIRGYRQWNYAKPWHYINVPDGVALEAARRSKRGDVLSAIDQMQRQLRDPDLTLQQQSTALKFLIHFVADVHQPLHVGRKADLGGNRIKVVYLATNGRQKKSNLHKFWDSDALNTSVSNPAAHAELLLGGADAALPVLNSAVPAAWAAESMAFRPEVYAFPEVSADQAARLDAGYRQQTLQILDGRLLLAGLRLARVLDDIYCNAQ